MADPEAGELDDVTLARAQRGEAAACRALVERYERPVFALLGRMVGAAGPVEDLAQETFLQVFRALPTFSIQGPARLSTWILTIASRRAIDELRRRELRPQPAALELELPAPERTDDGTRRARIAACIQRAVAELSPPFRAAFLLREYHGLDYAEIAGALDIDLGTVKSRLARARAALRQSLEELRDA